MTLTMVTSDESERAPTLSLTAEIFVIPHDRETFIVYAPLRRVAFVANGSMVNKLADIKEGLFTTRTSEDVALLEFLERLEIVNGGPELEPSHVFSGTPAPTQVTLFLTTACNLRCTYCYASAGDKPARFMGIETAKRAIDFVARNAERQSAGSFSVIYHGGGEPTVHWKVLVESMDYAREVASRRGLQVRASSGTNGVLSENQLRWMAANLEGVTLSFDGLPEVHDTHRLTVLGQPSSASVMHTMKYFDNSSFPYGLRMTVTADQIGRLPDSVEFICARFKPTRIQVEPSYQLGRWLASPSAETDEFIRSFREARFRAAKYGREATYSAARIDTVSNHFCGITQDSFAVTPDGEVSACYEVFSQEQEWSSTFFYGRESMSGDYEFNLPVLNGLRDQVVNTRSFCKGCYARWHCAGDCHHKALTISGSEAFAGTERCHITRELTKDELTRRIIASGGLLWHGNNDSDESRPSGKELL